MSTDKILIIDDQPDNVRMLSEHFLKNFDCEVVAVFSVDDAEKHLRSEVFQLIVSDYEMPGKSGGELVKLLNQLPIAAPLLFYTGIDKPT